MEGPVDPPAAAGGALIGFLLMILKVGLIVALVLFALWLFRRKDSGGEARAE